MRKEPTYRALIRLAVSFIALVLVAAVMLAMLLATVAVVAVNWGWLAGAGTLIVLVAFAVLWPTELKRGR